MHVAHGESDRADRVRGAAGGKKPVMVKMGINHVTTLIEKKQAQLVIIAHDVDPIEVIILNP